MILDRPSNARGHISAGWLDSRHTFSFGHYHDPQWMGFGPLRVINEDRVAPGAGFPTHGHANMEILSYVLSGALAHRDDHGGEGVLRPGELQWMSAGRGIEHSEFNASKHEPVHFLQIWIQPDRINAAPSYDQRRFDLDKHDGDWCLLASPDGAQHSIAIRQHAWLRAVRLVAGQSATWVLDPARRYWLHIARGAVALGESNLVAGDAQGFIDESSGLVLGGTSDVSEVLIFDLPR